MTTQGLVAVLVLALPLALHGYVFARVMAPFVRHDCERWLMMVPMVNWFVSIDRLGVSPWRAAAAVLCGVTVSLAGGQGVPVSLSATIGAVGTGLLAVILVGYFKHLYDSFFAVAVCAVVAPAVGTATLLCGWNKPFALAAAALVQAVGMVVFTPNKTRR